MELELRVKQQSGCDGGCPSCVCRKPIDDVTGFEVDERFRRFRQRMDIFNRASWDPAIGTDKARQFFASYFTDRAQFRKSAGFGHRDFALRNSSWYVADFTADMFVESKDRMEGFLDSYSILRPGAKTRSEDATAEQNSSDVKRAARFLGADLVGICEYDERWVYTHNYSRKLSIEKENDLPPISLG